MTPKKLSDYPVHLGRGGTAVRQPLMAREMSWYAAYAERHADDGVEGRLVSTFLFTADWTVWERHPAGDELVCCLAGAMTLHQELADGSLRSIRLMPGEYAINPPDVWHTADIEGEARALFITAGVGTENRPR